MNAVPKISTLRHVVLLLMWVALLATLFAELEIQIEGAHGWAAGLPTWRVDDAPILKLFFGGRAITGYHVFAFSFMFCVFHLPIVLVGHFAWRIEARILGSLMLFWMVEDFLWFVLNPAFGLAKFTPQHVPWHPHWLLGVPVDYIVFTLLAVALLFAAYRRPRTMVLENCHETADPARLGR
jgi:hypothetical protein